MPLFFKEETIMSPVGVNGLYVFIFGFGAFISLQTPSISKNVGRVQTFIGTALLGIIFWVIMASVSRLWKYWWFVCPLHICRTALVQSSNGLKKSILMDSCSADQRAYWNGLDSINLVGWSG